MAGKTRVFFVDESGGFSGSAMPEASEVIIGACDTGAGATLVLDDPAVESEHARLDLGSRPWKITDLDNASQIRIEGDPLPRSASRGFQPGEILGIGGKRLFLLPENWVFSGSGSIVVFGEYCRCLNLPVLHSGIPLIRELTVKNVSREPTREVPLEIRFEGESKPSFSVRIPALPPEGRTTVQVPMTIARSRFLFDGDPKRSWFEVLLDGIPGVFPVWVLGCFDFPFDPPARSSLCAFVQREHPIVADAVRGAEKYGAALMRELEEKRGLVGLASFQDLLRAGDTRSVARLLFEFLQQEGTGISFLKPRLKNLQEFLSCQRISPLPAFFPKGSAACLDLSLFFAACLENAGLAPVILVMDGPLEKHAMPGFWDNVHPGPHGVLTDWTRILGHLEKGELVVFESLEILSSQKPSFKKAEKKPAEDFSKVTGKGGEVFLVDIGCLRNWGTPVLPLNLQGEKILLAPVAEPVGKQPETREGERKGLRESTRAGAPGRIVSLHKSFTETDEFPRLAYLHSEIVTEILGSEREPSSNVFGDPVWDAWGLALFHWKEGSPSLGLEKAGKALEEFRRTRDRSSARAPGLEGATHRNKLLELSLRGIEIRCRTDSMLDSLEFNHSREERKAQVDCLQELGVTLENAHRALPPLGSAADAWFAKGIWRFLQKKNPEALAEFKQVLALAPQLVNPLARSEAGFWMAMAFERWGRTDEALSLIDSACGELKCSKVTGKKRSLLECLLHAHRARLFRYRDPTDMGGRLAAESDLERALSLARRLGEQNVLSTVHNFMGDFLLEQGKITEAEKEFATSKEMGLRSGFPRVQAHALYSRAKLLGVTLASSKKKSPQVISEIRECLQDACLKFAGIQDEGGKGMALLRLGRLESKNEPGRALETLRKARASLRGAGTRFHLFRALFESWRICVLHPELAREAGEITPRNYLKTVWSALARKEIPRLRLTILESLGDLSLSKVIDDLLQDGEEDVIRERAEAAISRVRGGFGYLVHDYGGWLERLGGRMGVMDEGKGAGGPLLKRIAAGIGTLTRELRRNLEKLSWKESDLVGVKTQIMEIDIRKLIVEQVIPIFELLGDSRVDLQIGGDLPKVHGDQVLLWRVLLNLMVNAQKAIDEGNIPGVAPTITVSAVNLSGREAKPAVLLGVSDTGSGIPEEKRKTLWTRGVSGFKTGKGLGLAFSRKAISMMGGELYLGDPGENGKRGATFAIRIPCHQ